MSFTNEWHCRNEAVWQKIVAPRLPGSRVRWLEIGSHEGRSAAWALDNLLGDGDEIVCVDYWPNPEIEARFDANLAGRATKFRVQAWDYLVQALAAGERFSVVYIDSDHDGKAVLEQSVAAWRLLEIGGLLILDDYRWHHPDDHVGSLDPAAGVEAFLLSYAMELVLLHKGAQVIVEKRPHVY